MRKSGKGILKVKRLHKSTLIKKGRPHQNTSAPILEPADSPPVPWTT